MAVGVQSGWRGIQALVAWSLLALAAWASGQAAGQQETLRVDLGGGLSMEFVLTKPRTFTMGSDKPGPIVGRS